jgi:hypothetical protein
MRNIAVTIQDPQQITSCCNPLAPVPQLPFNSRSVNMSFSQVQQVFVVEHYLSSRSYLTCQNEFRGNTFPNSPVPKKSTVPCLVNLFRDARSVQNTNVSSGPSVLRENILDYIRQILWHSPRKSLSLQSGLSYRNVRKTNRTRVRNGLHDLSITLHNWQRKWYMLKKINVLFIQLIGQEPCLYNKCSLDYSRRHKTDLVCCRIAQVMVQRRWCKRGETSTSSFDYSSSSF